MMEENADVTAEKAANLKENAISQQTILKNALA